MSNDHARITAAATMLDDLVERVVEIGEDLLDEGAESLAHDMFEVERSLRSAQRRLSTATRQTGR